MNQVMIQRVANGIVMTPMIMGAKGAPLDKIHVFSDEYLKALPHPFLEQMLKLFAEPDLVAPVTRDDVQEVRDIIGEQAAG